MKISPERFALLLAAGAALLLASPHWAAGQQKAAERRTLTKPKELVLVEPGAITRRTVAAWRRCWMNGSIGRFTNRRRKRSARAGWCCITGSRSAAIQSWRRSIPNGWRHWDRIMIG